MRILQLVIVQWLINSKWNRNSIAHVRFLLPLEPLLFYFLSETYNS
jgi:hypothetical protein